MKINTERPPEEIYTTRFNSEQRINLNCFSGEIFAGSAAKSVKYLKHVKLPARFDFIISHIGSDTRVPYIDTDSAVRLA